MKSTALLFILAIAGFFYFVAGSPYRDGLRVDGPGASFEVPPVQQPAKPLFGLFCVPGNRLSEAYANGIRMVRPPYRTEGEWDYRLPNRPIALTRYIDLAARAGMTEVLFEPDRRLTLGAGKRNKRQDSSWVQSISLCRRELDTLFARLHRRFGTRIKLRAYIDEPSKSAGQDTRTIIAYAASSAHRYGIAFDIATMDAADSSIWYYRYADELLVTRYDVGAHKDNNPRTTSDRRMNWTEKWNDCNAIKVASGKTVLPIVAAHNWDSTCYGGFNDWGYPAQEEIRTYIRDIALSVAPERCWIYCGDDGAENLWNLPKGSPQIRRLFSLTAAWPGR